MCSHSLALSLCSVFQSLRRSHVPQVESISASKNARARGAGRRETNTAISGKDVPTEWHDRTNRAVFTWQEPRRKGGTVSYEDRKEQRVA